MASKNLKRKGNKKVKNETYKQDDTTDGTVQNEIFAVHSNIVKAGYFAKKTGTFNNWKRRYFVLTSDYICYYKNDKEANLRRKTTKELLLTDIVSITEDVLSTKRAFALRIESKKGEWILQASNEDDKQKWLDVLFNELGNNNGANYSPKNTQPDDTKTVMLHKENGSIGCGIKKAGQYIVVSGVYEGYYVAKTGVLRPGDEIIAVRDELLADKTLEDVINMVKAAPDSFEITIRPFRSVPKYRDITPSNYATIAPFSISNYKCQPKLSPPSRNYIPQHYYDDDNGDPSVHYASLVLPKKEDPVYATFFCN